VPKQATCRLRFVVVDIGEGGENDANDEDNDEDDLV
jgi:hypothetical protein